MQELATLFIILVTFTSTTVPGVNLAKVLDYNPLAKTSLVLSENDELQEAGESATTEKRREEIKARMEKYQEERKNVIEEMKNSAEQTKELRKKERLEFKERLAEIKDEKKQEAVTKIDERLVQLNLKWVSHWNDVLTRLTSILAKIETRTEEANKNGSDTASITEAIASAKNDISLAQEAVTTQSEKTYTITITEESNLGQDVKRTINTFHNDIKTAKDAVEKARKSVVNVLRLLKGVSGQKPEGEINESER